jgi:hypothetical protein
MPRAAFLAILALWAGCRSEAREPDERVVALVATAEVKGTTEPCGCNSDPLGDVARVAALARDGLWLDAGSLLYDEVPAGSASRAQSDMKASALASIYKGAELGLGADDLRRGPAGVKPVRLAANVKGMKTAPSHVRVVDGVKVGLFGVVTPARVAEAKVQAGDPVPAARAAVAKLKKEGAQVIVGLLGMSRDEARALLTAVPGIGFGIIGADVGEGMPEAEPVNGGFLVAPADQGRRAVRIELHVKKGVVALASFAGEAARKVSIERLQRKIGNLTLELAGWKGDPSADKAFVAAREKELADLKAEQARLESEHPTPPDASYFTYALEPVRRALPRDPKVADALLKLAGDIGKHNFEAAKAIPPPAPEEGKPTYVGMAACQKCHKAQLEFWKHTVHAQAWKTLVAVDKQYNYDCTACHVTGWYKPGGANLATVEKQGLVDVQCEVCHGPGSKHVEEAGLDDPKTLVLKPADRFCADNCHTKEHSDTFQLEAYLRDILGKGHGEKRRKELGDGVTGHELRSKALAASSR